MLKSSTHLPKQLKIANYIYKVILVSELDVEGESCYGIHDPVKLEIKLKNNQIKYQEADTLLHEILHALFVVTHIKDVKEPTEEFVVASVAAGLCQVFMDNPQLRKYINEVFK